MKRWLLALLVVACSEPHGHVDPSAIPPAWQTVFDKSVLDRTLLSVWGTSGSDVFAVGGPRGNSGYEALVLHFDGTTWRDLHAGGPETYWWVHGSSPQDVWFVGEQGRMTHWDGTSLSESPRKTTATLFGVFAFSPNDAWAVGGTPETGGPDDVLLHWDGTAWTDSPLPKTLGRTHYKVWGTGSDNLYVVGEAGTIWHKKGSTWALEGDNPPVAHGTLLTVTGCDASHVFAVGSRDVLSSDGATWSAMSPAPQIFNDVNGVACSQDGKGGVGLLVVGFGSLKQRFEGGAWIDDSSQEPLTDLHGSWTDGAGSYWVAGGDFAGPPSPGKPRAGVLARYGPGTVTSDLER
jgi:hypothetical protein